MYKWAVTIYLKSGAVLKGVAKCDEDNSTDLFNMLMERKDASRIFNAISSEDEKGNLFYAVDDVSAMELRPWGVA